MVSRTNRQQKKDRMDMASLVISAASLGVGIAALCLNEKTEEGKEMANKIDSSKYSTRKDLKKAYAKEIKRTAVTDIGYTGTVIVLNEKGEQTSYGLVPLDVYGNRNAKGSSCKTGKKKSGSKSGKPRSDPGKKSWVAMEMNTRTGGNRQAIVCSSRDEARNRAISMKKAHRSETVAAECRQGYAQMDTSKTIDVAKWFSGSAGTLYTV